LRVTEIRPSFICPHCKAQLESNKRSVTYICEALFLVAFLLALDWVLGSITNLLISIVVTVLFFQFGIFLPFLRLRKVGPQVNSEA
jgi:hypothetical protein